MFEWVLYASAWTFLFYLYANRKIQEGTWTKNSVYAKTAWLNVYFNDSCSNSKSTRRNMTWDFTWEYLYDSHYLRQDHSAECKLSLNKAAQSHTSFILSQSYV